MKSVIEKYLSDKKMITEDLQRWVNLDTVPLKERWEVFIQSGLGTTDGYVPDFEGVVDELLEKLVSKFQRGDVINIQDLPNYGGKYVEDMEAYMQSCLKLFVKEFKIDW